jgi:2-C-methyl-D-erythritol 4-phosphate cytidylyltransferase
MSSACLKRARPSTKSTNDHLMNRAPFWLVIPAAGIGARMQADRPKQYLQVAGRCIIEHSLDCFLEHPDLLGVVVCLAPDDPYWPTLACSRDPRITRANGGRERADSVLQGLLRLTEMGAGEQDWVLVHDAARPNLSRVDLDLLLSELANDPVGGLLAVPARDTLKRAGADGRVTKTIYRRHVWHAFTPQMFRCGVLQHALAEALVANVAITDEASALEWAGQAPRLIEGRADNLKITRPEDLEWLRQRWSAQS